jgi:hypothetical protein
MLTDTEALNSIADSLMVIAGALKFGAFVLSAYVVLCILAALTS